MKIKEKSEIKKFRIIIYSIFLIMFVILSLLSYSAIGSDYIFYLLILIYFLIIIGIIELGIFLLTRYYKDTPIGIKLWLVYHFIQVLAIGFLLYKSKFDIIESLSPSIAKLYYMFLIVFSILVVLGYIFNKKLAFYSSYAYIGVIIIFGIGGMAILRNFMSIFGFIMSIAFYGYVVGYYLYKKRSYFGIKFLEKIK